MSSDLNLSAQVKVERGELLPCDDGPPILTKLFVGDPELRPKQLILEQFRDQRVCDIGVDILTALASVDGALIIDRAGRLITFGTILRTPGRRASHGDEGARTTAARFASHLGLAITVSTDGPVSAYYRGKELYQ